MSWYIYNTYEEAQAHVQRVDAVCGYPNTETGTITHCAIIKKHDEDKWAIIKDQTTQTQYTSGASEEDNIDNFYDINLL